MTKPLHTLSLFWSLALIASLWQFALTQPILDLLGRTPEFFVAHDSQLADLLLFTVLLSLVLPLLWIIVLRLLRFFHATLFAGVYFLSLTALIFGIVLPPAHFLEEYQRYLPILVALIAAIACVLLLARIRLLQDFSKFLAVGVLIIPLNFLLLSPASKIVLPVKLGESAPTTKTAARKDVTVILVVFDALPLASLMTTDGSIDRERFPGFAALASSSTWYRNAVTVASSTFHAIPAIVTGEMPTPGLTPTMADHPNNIFGELRDVAQQFVYEPLTNLCPQTICRSATQTPFGERFLLLLDDSAIVYAHYLLPDFMREDQPPLTEQWKNFRKHAAGSGEGEQYEGLADRAKRSKMVLNTGSADVTEIFRENIARIKPRKHSTLYFQHLMIPHIPWRYIPSGQEYAIRSAPNVDKKGVWVADEWLVTQAYQRHLLQVGAVDKLVADLIQHLHAQDMFDQTMLIVAADHGVSFQMGLKKRVLQLENSIDIASIPLFVKYPHQGAGEIVDSLVSTVDITPTILAEFGLPMRETVVGNNLRSLDAGDAVGAVNMPLYNGAVALTKITRESLQLHRDKLVERKEHLFPTRGHGPDDWFFPRDEYGLVGRATQSIGTTARNPALRASIWKRKSFSEIVLTQKSLPVRMMGGVLGAKVSDPPVALAVALNGKIAAVTRSYAKNDLVYYSAMLPRELLQSGNNEIVTYAIHAQEAGDVLISRLSE